MLRKIIDTDIKRLLEIEAVTQISPWSAEVFTRCLEVGYFGWVIEENQQVVGYIIISNEANEVHILNLCVDPAFQNQGYGSKLLDEALKISKEQHAQFAYLEVRRSNLTAINLYKKMAFKQIAERKEYYTSAAGTREDALVFVKNL